MSKANDVRYMALARPAEGYDPNWLVTAIRKLDDESYKAWSLFFKLLAMASSDLDEYHSCRICGNGPTKASEHRALCDSCYVQMRMLRGD